MAERELVLDLTEEAKDLLVEKGWDPAMGARPLRRAIQRYIEDPLADFVLQSQLQPGSTVVVDPAPEGDEREVRLTIVKPKKAKTPVAVGAGGAEGDIESDVTDEVPGGVVDDDDVLDGDGVHDVLGDDADSPPDD
jgi:ATP-dependent Clp protease ATP-binding subunit ClpC